MKKSNKTVPYVMGKKDIKISNIDLYRMDWDELINTKLSFTYNGKHLIGTIKDTTCAEYCIQIDNGGIIKFPYNKIKDIIIIGE